MYASPFQTGTNKAPVTLDPLCLNSAYRQTIIYANVVSKPFLQTAPMLCIKNAFAFAMALHRTALGIKRAYEETRGSIALRDHSALLMPEQGRRARKSRPDNSWAIFRKYKLFFVLSVVRGSCYTITICCNMLQRYSMTYHPNLSSLNQRQNQAWIPMDAMQGRRSGQSCQQIENIVGLSLCKLWPAPFQNNSKANTEPRKAKCVLH